METIIMGIIIVTLCVLYGITSHLYAKQKEDLIIDVEAGPTSECACVLSKEKAISKIIKLPNGRFVDSQKYVRIKIHGNCMEPRDILNGEQWLVSKVNHNKPVEDNIKVGDVVLIHLKDKNLYKIREVKHISDNSLDTIRYENGVEKKSSKPHSYGDVIGVVQYAI